MWCFFLECHKLLCNLHALQAEYIIQFSNKVTKLYCTVRSILVILSSWDLLATIMLKYHFLFLEVFFGRQLHALSQQLTCLNINFFLNNFYRRTKPSEQRREPLCLHKSRGQLSVTIFAGCLLKKSLMLKSWISCWHTSQSLQSAVQKAQTVQQYTMKVTVSDSSMIYFGKKKSKEASPQSELPLCLHRLQQCPEPQHQSKVHRREGGAQSPWKSVAWP